MSGSKDSSISALAKSIQAIDSLIEDLRSGKLFGASSASVGGPVSTTKGQSQGPKEKKLKKEKTSKGQSKGAATVSAGSAVEGAALFGKARIVVGRIESVVPHANSDKLYITQVNVGESENKQIVAGLQKFCTVEELENSLVCVVLNLKPAKLGGELSQGMILASTSSENPDNVKPIRPPEDSPVGEAVFLEGSNGADESCFVKTLKSDHWRKIAAGLAVSNCKACFEGKPIVTSAGTIVAVDFPDTSTIS